MFCVVRRFIFVCVLSFMPFSVALGAPDSAVNVVKDFQTGIIDVLKKLKTLDVNGRYNLVRKVTKENMHLPLMIATASSPYWRAGTKAQREKLVNAFHRMGASSIVTLFDSYDGEVFRIWRSRKTSGRTVLVDTKIGNPKDPDPTEVTYVTAKIKGRWWIIDVIVAGGISEVRVRRNEFAAVLKKGGLDQLIAVLNTKADRLLSGKEKAAVGGK